MQEGRERLDEVRRPRGRLGALPPLMLWAPLLATLLIALLWWFAITRADAMRAAAQAGALREALAAAQAYEQYLTRSVAQMDQVSMQLKQSWEQSPGRLLETMTRDGMFLDHAFDSVSIVDRSGIVVSSTRAELKGASFAADAFFRFHKNNNSSSLRIGAPPGAQTAVHEAVMFSRRIEQADDDFAGVVVVIVPGRYFTSFYMPSTLGRGGSVATMGADSALRVEPAPAGAQPMPGAPAPPLENRLSAFPDNAQLWSATEGATLVRGSAGFRDGQAHLLGWRHSPVYPLVGLVALSHRDAVAGAAVYWRDSRNNAILGTLCLALAALTAVVLSRRAALRVQAKDDVRLAYRTATESANDGFYMAVALRDADDQIVDFEIVDCNERGAFFYGMSRKTLIGTRLSAIDAGIFGQALFDTYHHAMQVGFYEDEREMPADNRLNITWGQRRLVRVGNGLAITLRDISERKAHVVALQRLANEDPLTGLPNRHWLMDFLPRVMQQTGANGAGLALLFIDLDEFKYVNDAHGHASGDQVLAAAAERLRSLVRPSDHVVRFGGDEFIVLLAPTESSAQTAQVANRIVTAFTMPFPVGTEMHEVGASVGISLFPQDATDAATLIKMGDIAMYASKSEGKGQYRFFAPSLSHTLQTRSQLKHNLQEAIDKDQFVLHYQARVDAASGELCSMEALIRWIHPVHGMIPPLDFIPFAEQSGLILRIGELVMEKACMQLAAWRRAGLALVPVSINVSPKQFTSGGVHRKLAMYLERYDLVAGLLEVEVTETAMMGNQVEVLAELSALRELGVKLHVDDFGTGYSSLSQLQKLRMDVLKVDRAFTSELGKSGEGRVFFQAIVSMAHALGMSVVAEGVETQAQLEILRELACNEVQGYLIARPLPAAEMAALMHRRFLLAQPGADGPPALLQAAR